MKVKRHNQVFFAFSMPMAFLLYLLDSTGVITFKVGTAHPILLIPFLVAIAMATREWIGLYFGAALGLFLDITSADGYIFNFIMLILIGCICGLFSSHLVNDNIYSATALSFASCIFYFAAKWLIFFVFTGRGESLNYLITYALPSAAYSALFIVPFYYIIRAISRKTSYYN